ncbi:MAG: hypothetical protein K6E95_01415 [Lachnospiraceae bacterium]|nr:hypothetical protein [Lachnospiraceae bacterium]
MIEWDKDLRARGKAKRKEKKIRKLVEKRRLRSVNYYCLAFPSNKDNILDIYNMGEFLFAHYRKDYTSNIHIIGLADNRDEAAELARDIIDEVYRKSGTFDVERYFRDARNHPADP